MSAHTDATFVRKFSVILGALVAFTVFVLLAANLVTAASEAGSSEDPRLHNAVLERIRPVGTVNVAAPPAPPPPEPETAAAEPAAVEGADESASSDEEPVAEADAEVPAEGGEAEVADAEAAESEAPAADASDDSASAEAVLAVPAVVESAEAVTEQSAVAASATEAAASEAPAEEVVESAEVVAEEASAAEAGAEEAVAESAESAPAAAAAAGSAAQQATGVPVDVEHGKYIYDTVCFACHMVGVAGAPKLGDKAAWEPRVAQGMNALLSSVINGKGAMPPKGGRSDLPDVDVAAAITYMVGEAK